ncbi:hypothetical protein NQ317_010600 [Molorchus minor]|uniref:Alpha-taxilin n=1 Tax=Molorchus minor TaxID=1323400 RepID=A0ABQ9JS19_9CUCU|nr:hypothetical protein NQ317_010600 [Molorchus minor]
MPESERLGVVRQRYNDLYNDLRQSNSALSTLQRQYTALQKERDHIQAELTKNILAKSKLESLCREMQKQNKLIKEENIARIKEEEERRREVSNSFTEKLNTLTALMEENKDKSTRLRDENVAMSGTLSQLQRQFQEREESLSNMNRQLDLQRQISETKIRKMELQYQSEHQLWEQEREMLLKNIERSDLTNSSLQENVNSLQEHLDVYKSQYADFEDTMQRSNKMFESFRIEMNKLKKTNSTLEKERNELQARLHSCTNSVLQATELQQQSSAEQKIAERKVQTLQKLCRQLQAERAAYLQQLEQNDIKPVTVQSQDEEKENKLEAQEKEAPEKLAKKEKYGPTSNSLWSPAAKKNLGQKEKLLAALKTELKSMEDDLKAATERQEVLATEDATTSTAVMEGQGEEVLKLKLGDADHLALVIWGELKSQSCPGLVETDKRAGDGLTGKSLKSDLSRDAIPLCKPEGVTDITAQPSAKEEDVDPRFGDKATAPAEETEKTELYEEDSISDSIPLKEAKGKTEIKTDE